MSTVLILTLTHVLAAVAGFVGAALIFRKHSAAFDAVLQDLKK